MTYLSGFTSHHANLKRIHCDSREMKRCCVENDTKTQKPSVVGFYLQSGWA